MRASVPALADIRCKLFLVTQRLASDAPAKLNLTLRVGARRPDGFHQIESLVVPIDFCDTVHVETAPPGSLSISTTDSTIPTDDRNLALRAARLLAQYAESRAGAHVHLEKRIPTGAGLGGGSSDAATTLRLLNELWGLRLAREALSEVGAQVGSDVSLFLHEGPCLVRGRGEQVQPLTLQVQGYAILLLSDIHCSTADVYRRFDERPAPTTAGRLGRGGYPPERLSPVYFATALRSATDLLNAAYNDLEPAAIRVAPDLGRLLAKAAARSPSAVRMTGSGSALYTLAESASAARAVAAAWRDLPARAAIARLRAGAAGASV